MFTDGPGSGEDRSPVTVPAPKPEPVKVQLGCSHWTEAVHNVGERSMACPTCGQRWVVTAVPVRAVGYEVRPDRVTQD